MATPDSVSHGWMHGKVFLLKNSVDGERFVGRWVGGEPELTPVFLGSGTKVKVVMVSRFGDCGITDDLEATCGYVARVYPSLLELTEE